MPKILVLNNDLNLGGGQKSLVSFLAYISSIKGFEIDLMLWQKDGPLQKMLPEKIHLIFREYPVAFAQIKSEKNKIRQLKLLAQFIKFRFVSKVIRKPWHYYPNVKKQYDVAISYTHHGYPYLMAADRVRAAEKFLWFHHGKYTSTGKKKEIDRKYFSRFDNIINVSESNKTELIKSFPTLQNKMLVIPNLIIPEEIERLAEEKVQDMPQQANTLNFVTVSRFSKEKGLDLAIDIAAELKNKGLAFRWYFIGDGDNFSEIVNLAKQKELTDVCLFLGNKENPYPYIRSADLYIQSSYIEAHPITLNEALILKKLIVTSDLPSTREVLNNGSLGVLCKLDKAEFSEKIMKLLANKEDQNYIIHNLKNHKFNNRIAYERINKLFGI